ncbi:MAG: FliG C-terminal domain-containing protein [Acidobacteriota bacterium]
MSELSSSDKTAALLRLAGEDAALLKRRVTLPSDLPRTIKPEVEHAVVEEILDLVARELDEPALTDLLVDDELEVPLLEDDAPDDDEGASDTSEDAELDAETVTDGSVVEGSDAAVAALGEETRDGVSVLPGMKVGALADELAGIAAGDELDPESSGSVEAEAEQVESEARDEEEEMQVGLAELAEVPPKRLAQFLGEEHPQTVALVLGSLPPEHAGNVLKELEPSLKVETVLRLARLDAVAVGPQGRALGALRHKMSTLPVEEVERSSGVKAAAGVLKILGRETASEILGTMASQEPDLSQEIEQNIYTFEDLIVLSQKDARKLVPKLDRQALAVALTAASDDVKDLILGSMSSGMRATLEEEMEFGGLRKAAEIQQAQQDIVQAALQADEEGEISFVKGPAE